MSSIYNVTKEKGEYTATREIRKHIAWYVKGMPNATVIRDKINSVETEEDFKKAVDLYRKVEREIENNYPSKKNKKEKNRSKL